MINYFSN